MNGAGRAICGHVVEIKGLENGGEGLRRSTLAPTAKVVKINTFSSWRVGWTYFVLNSFGPNPASCWSQLDTVTEMLVLVWA